MNQQPTILHLICHGFIRNGESYLIIEDKKGTAHEFSSKEMDKMLGNVNDTKMKVVFINACHSEEFGKVFRRNGV